MRITVDNRKNTYLGGSTHGDYAGRQQGNGDCLLIKMNEKGYIYHVGKTGGNLFNTLKGEHDVFILKLELDKGLTEN